MLLPVARNHISLLFFFIFMMEFNFGRYVVVIQYIENRCVENAFYEL